MKVKDVMKKLNLGTQPTVTISATISKTLTEVKPDKLLKNTMFTWEATEINEYADYTVNGIDVLDGRNIIIYVK